MFPFTDLHILADDLVVGSFDHTHWWLHLVVHIVVVAGPVALLAVLIAWCLRLLRGYRRRSTQRGAAAPADLGRSALVPGVFGYLLRQTWRSQLWLLLGAVLSLPVLYATLELPKVIINNAIDSGHFPIRFGGFLLSQSEFLFILCFLFLAAVLANGSLKYLVNLYTGRVAEALVRRLRLTVHREWRRRGRPGGPAQLIPVVTQEVEPVGGFAGEAFVLPVLQGGTFLTILTFMLVQDPILGAAAVTLLPLQLMLIPRLQRRINALGRERVQEVRQLGAIIGNEDSNGLSTLHDSFRRIQAIRFEIYKRKFFMKGLSNFISQMTPFFFYTIGGYLVIEGKLSFGALVAVLVAYKDFSAPLRELFRYYQTMEDVRVRYEELRCFLTGPCDHSTEAVVFRRAAPAATAEVPVGSSEAGSNGLSMARQTTTPVWPAFAGQGQLACTISRET
ncbi:ABC transporter ATP-binding protein [Rhodoligotrophos defluvii]|uniref:ABC transporter ATP-binding protein n=1 Tax=Rhodoligotrophos defluvii TaxID=2561934 RepID=UPI0010CA0E23|nr:ABC transporter ATP-binding protein [Rhodoligotrophos defluvii]